jgi:hypothetical protein
MNTRFVVAGSSATDWTLNDEGVETLMHELAHVWQFQHQGWGYVPAALWAQELGDAIGKDAYDWKSLANRHVPWEKWNPEAQARAAEDYNKLLQAGRSGTLSPDEYQMLQLLSAYTDKMAAGPQTS